jgi:3-oxoacyl-(acyl-carrier-protein) synthase
VDKLTKFSLLSSDLQFPSPDRLQAPLRSTATGGIITEGSLWRLALENTLLKPADWYRTLLAATLQLPHTQKIIASVGSANCIPSSLVSNSGIQVVPLSTLGASISPNGGSPNTKFTTNGTNGHTSTESYSPNEQGQDSPYPPQSIAIVGMSGRFAGADDLNELWELLLSGKSMVQRAPVEKLNLPVTGDYEGTEWWGNFLRNSTAFDNRFFKKSSREAIAWDPQQRILLEVVYEALESAGYFGAKATKEPSDYGCYIGAVMNNYYDNVSCHPATAYATLGTSRCFISGCMSHYFGWTGPSLTIDTACSSSLVAINTACRAIWSGECSRAIAGGTNVITSPFDYQNLRAAGFLSPSGQCKPFDADADGYCRGEGVGVIVLKTLADAIKENDNIFGVIVGSSANQNQNHSHITVPFSGSQVNLYQNVLDMAGADPKSVSYVEAHGTGTGVGDPVECRSIREAFGGESRENTLYFGSIKGNIGHVSIRIIHRSAHCFYLTAGKIPCK